MKQKKASVNYKEDCQWPQKKTGVQKKHMEITELSTAPKSPSVIMYSYGTYHDSLLQKCEEKVRSPSKALQAINKKFQKSSSNPFLRSKY
jgi:hypothetical protein